MNSLRKTGLFIAGISLVIWSVFSCKRTENQKLTIATSANMQFTMEELTAAFEAQSGIQTDMIVSSSGKLTAQIRHNAPYDVFVSADMKFPDTLFALGLTYGKPEIYAYGGLVMWTLHDDLSPGFDILTSDRVKHIALANPRTAPYGEVAKTVLNKKGLYTTLLSKMVFGESVSQTNRFILSGVADIGFTARSVVFSSRVKGEGKWVDVPDSLYEPIAQGVVLLKIRKENTDKALKFKEFLLSDEAARILKKNGFNLPGSSGN